MPTHDCTKCPVENCPLRGIAPWLNEHEDELVVAMRETREELAQTCVLVVRGIPIPIYNKETIVTAIQDAFTLGYCKGRTYQGVPEVFKEGVK